MSKTKDIFMTGICYSGCLFPKPYGGKEASPYPGEFWGGRSDESMFCSPIRMPVKYLVGDKLRGTQKLDLLNSSIRRALELLTKVMNCEECRTIPPKGGGLHEVHICSNHHDEYFKEWIDEIDEEEQ